MEVKDRDEHDDGFMEKEVVVALCAEQRIPTSAVSELVRSGRWERHGDGYRIHDFSYYNPRTSKDRTARHRERQREIAEKAALAVGPIDLEGLTSPDAQARLLAMVFARRTGVSCSTTAARELVDDYDMPIDIKLRVMLNVLDREESGKVTSIRYLRMPMQEAESQYHSQGTAKSRILGRVLGSER